MATRFFSRAVEFLEVARPEGATNADMRLQNKDLLPVPEAERLWKARNFWAFWLADSFNLGTFMIASGMLAQGLSVWQAWACVWVGYGTAAVFLVLNAVPGARHHIIFPAYMRASWGPIGSLWPVFNRAAMACIWYGVQAWIGGECVFTLITAMAPSFANLSNGIPNSGTDTAHLISFLLFSGGSLVVLWFPLHTIRHLFTVKAIVAPIGGLALFGWCIAKAGGAGPLLSQGATKSGSQFGWAFTAAMMACLGNMATLITNATDFASRADKPSAVVLPQLIALPFTFAIVSLFGILIGSSSVVIFGEFVWSPNEIMARFLQDSPSAGTRAGVFFISAAFILAQLGTNVAANSISAGCDLTALFPRFITIRRGGYVAAFVGLVMCPWNLLKDSNSFASYLSAYSVFLSSIIGVMIANYWVVSGRKVKVDDLYTMAPEGRYRFWYGINLRAYAAYICGILPNIVGFVGAIGKAVPIAATHVYEMSFFTGFGASFLTFIVLNKVFPVEQPSKEECDLVTVGTAAWGTENAVWDEGSETKSFGKESETVTGVAAVRV